MARDGDGVLLLGSGDEGNENESGEEWKKNVTIFLRHQAPENIYDEILLCWDAVADTGGGGGEQYSQLG